MPLHPLTPVLTDARARGRGVAAFNVIQLEHAEAYAEAAAATDLPVVMQISENCVRYHGALRPLALATLAIGAGCDQPVVVHLDHATDPDLITEAIELGMTSVMFDGSRLPDDQNRALTHQVATTCQAAGVSLEAELGEVGGKDGVHAPGVRTDPSDARQFVADTGVDALAVAVGSSHAMTERTAALDEHLIGRLAQAVPVPLVLHGSSGVPDQGIAGAVRAGITKVNIATHLNQVFTRAVQRELAERPTVDTRRYLGAARRDLAQEAARLMQLITGSD